MIIDYQRLARLMENELDALRQVAVFYEKLAADLKNGSLPEVVELLSGGARSLDVLQRIREEKKVFLEGLGLQALRGLLASDYPVAVRRLVGQKGSLMVGVLRRIEEAGKKIAAGLAAAQLINRRLLGFFEQLSPAVISYQGCGRMAGRSPLGGNYTVSSSC